MSLKIDFEFALSKAANSYVKKRTEIVGTMNNRDYSVSGKRNAVQKIVDAHNRIVNECREEVISGVTQKINFIDGDEKEALRQRYKDVAYRTALSNSLDMIQLCAGAVTPEDMAAMLSMFENDPLAIAAISQVMGETAKKNGVSTMMYVSAIPADNRGAGQERLRKLQNTIMNELDALTLEMPKHGLDEQSEKDAFDAHEIPLEPIMSEISSTVDYMKHCNGDLTEYNPDVEQPGINLKEAYNRAFNP